MPGTRVVGGALRPRRLRRGAHRWLATAVAMAATAATMAGQAAAQAAAPGVAAASPGFPAAGCPTVAPARTLRLAEAIQAALCSDPRSAEAWAQHRAQLAQIELERRAWRPDGRLALGLQHADGRERDAEDEETTGRTTGPVAEVELSWVIHDFGLRAARLRAAHAGAEATAFGLADAFQQVGLGVAQAYVELLEAEDELALARESEAFLAGMQRRAAASPPDPDVAGDESQPEFDAIDRLKIVADLRSATLSIVQRERDVATARGRLAVRVGRAPTDPVGATYDGLDGPEPPAPDAIERMLELAAREQPGLRAARARVAQAEADEAVAEAADRATVSVGAGQYRTRDAYGLRDRTTVIGVRVEVPLFTRRSRAAAVRQARANADGARAAVVAGRQQVEVEVWAAFQKLKAATDSQVAAAAYLVAAEELLAAELGAFENGDGDIFDVVDAHASVIEARLGGRRLQTDVVMARIELAAALGRLGVAPAAPIGPATAAAPEPPQE